MPVQGHRWLGPLRAAQGQAGAHTHTHSDWDREAHGFTSRASSGMWEGPGVPGENPRRPGGHAHFTKTVAPVGIIYLCLINIVTK